MSRLTLLHINIIGAAVAIIVGVALYFTIITAGFDSIQTATKKYDDVHAKYETYNTAKTALATAKRNRDQAITDYRVFEAQYMPEIGYPPANAMKNDARFVMMMKLFWPNHGRSWPEKFMARIRSHMARENKVNRIVWENPGVLVMPAFGPDPNTIEAAPGEGFGPVLHYKYPMAVRARSLDLLMRHIQDWTSIRWAGVPTVDGLSITGNSPDLRASYTLTLTIIVRDEEYKRVPPENRRISGSAGQRSNGGGMMGGMAGPMGMSGMMGGGGMMGAPMLSGGGGMMGPPMMSGGGMMGAPMMSGGGMMGPPMMSGGGMMGAPMMGGGGMMGAPMMSGGGMTGGPMSGNIPNYGGR